jgi:hypothetical protein
LVFIFLSEPNYCFNFSLEGLTIIIGLQSY